MTAASALLDVHLTGPVMDAGLDMYVYLHACMHGREQREEKEEGRRF